MQNNSHETHPDKRKQDIFINEEERERVLVKLIASILVRRALEKAHPKKQDEINNNDDDSN